MEKVKNIFLSDKSLGTYHTGLVLEMENGKWFIQHTTDPVQTYSEIPSPQSGDEVTDQSLSDNK